MINNSSHFFFFSDEYHVFCLFFFIKKKIKEYALIEFEYSLGKYFKSWYSLVKKSTICPLVGILEIPAISFVNHFSQNAISLWNLLSKIFVVDECTEL